MANLKVFPASTTHILEYWLDESMFSKWKRGALVPLPFDEQACRRDINWYRNLGCESITTFATWLGGPYVEKYGPADWAFRGYGDAFSNGKSAEKLTIGRKTHSIKGLYAPWSGMSDDTKLSFRASQDSLHFCFEVNEKSFTLVESFNTERCVDFEDRVELFFSPTADMSAPYYCIEIDPEGRAMDYAAGYYRDMDYSWTFPGYSVSSEMRDGFYSVRAAFSKKALEGLGIDVRKGFFIGIFRADFNGEDVVWYSRRPTADKEPDFHKPDVLVPVRSKF